MRCRDAVLNGQTVMDEGLRYSTGGVNQMERQTDREGEKH